MRNMLDVATVERQKVRVQAQNKRYAEAREKYVKLDLTDAEKKILAEIARIEKDVEGRYNLAIRQAENLNTEGAASIITTHIDPTNMKAVAEIDKLVQMQQEQARQVLKDSVDADQQLMMILVSITILAVAIGAAQSWFITRSITRPLNEAVAVAGRVADGDLTSEIPETHKDEIGQLFDALRQMNGSLGQIIGNVRTGTETMSVVSREIASGNADLSARTESQASSLEETASSMEELTSTVRQNAENARQANQLVISASDVAVRGGKVVGDVVDTMSSIKDSSRKIVDIISVIDGIAFQTNILALNAAVEAARAGEQGRGFAVVASEVRNLAQRSAAAAKEIKTLIGDSVDKVDTGSKLVTEAGATMEEIVTSVKRVTDIMAEILMASQEQSAGIEQVNQAIGQMDQVTQQNAALVEEAASAAALMQEQAAKLQDSVGVFKLSGMAQASLSLGSAAAHHETAEALRAPAAHAPVAPRVNKAEPRLPVRERIAATRSSDDWEEF
jgi:methyl-accepting chemotaxis protein